ncbi:hypothetical protein DFH09DRAFT_1105841 [Mycena vulgaris]|nr:hypothetical protein DFH09DRAFT_1105841 [Mycena vulgaris]
MCKPSEDILNVLSNIFRVSLVENFKFFAENLGEKCFEFYSKLCPERAYPSKSPEDMTCTVCSQWNQKGEVPSATVNIQVSSNPETLDTDKNGTYKPGEALPPRGTQGAAKDNCVVTVWFLGLLCQMSVPTAHSTDPQGRNAQGKFNRVARNSGERRRVPHKRARPAHLDDGVCGFIALSAYTPELPSSRAPYLNALSSGKDICIRWEAYSTVLSSISPDPRSPLLQPHLGTPLITPPTNVLHCRCHIEIGGRPCRGTMQCYPIPAASFDLTVRCIGVLLLRAACSGDVRADRRAPAHRFEAPPIVQQLASAGACP